VVILEVTIHYALIGVVVELDAVVVAQHGAHGVVLDLEPREEANVICALAADPASVVRPGLSLANSRLVIIHEVAMAYTLI